MMIGDSRIYSRQSVSCSLITREGMPIPMILISISPGSLGMCGPGPPLIVGTRMSGSIV